MQEQVPAEVIGTVNGVQGSLCEMFQITMYVGTLVITDPADFYILVAAAIGNVALSALIFTAWVCSLADNAEFVPMDDDVAEGIGVTMDGVQLVHTDEEEPETPRSHLSAAMADAGLSSEESTPRNSGLSTNSDGATPVSARGGGDTEAQSLVER